MEKIKVAVVGTGFIGPAHIEALRRNPNIEVAALCERERGIGQSQSRSVGYRKSHAF